MPDIKKIAKALGVPPTSEPQYDGLAWNKRGGYAGEKVVSKVRSRAEELGWSKRDNGRDTPDGSVARSNSELVDPTGKFVLETSSRYGVESSDNRYAIRIRMI